MTRALTALLGGAVVATASLADWWLGGAPGLGRGQLVVMCLGLGVAACALLPRRWNTRLLLAAGGSLCALIVAEGALRVLIGPALSTVHRPDPRLLFRHRPGAEKTFHNLPENGGEVVRIRINAEGFRGPALRPAGAARRVVVYGDSFVAAEFTPEAATFVSRLGQRLEASRGEPVEAINAGVIAYGPDQVALWMEESLPSLAADQVVVVVFAGNDFGDLLRNRLFRIAPDGALERRTPALSASVQARFRVALAPLALVRFGSRSWRAIVAADAAAATPQSVVEGWLQDRRREHQEWLASPDGPVADLFSDTWDADVALAPDSSSARDKRALMEAVLGRVVDAARGVPLLLVFVPSPIDLPGYGEARVDRVEHQDYRPGEANRALHAMAERRGWAHIDLEPAFRARGAGALYLRGGDDHWSEAGQDLAAELVVEALDRERDRSAPAPPRGSAPASP